MTNGPHWCDFGCRTCCRFLASLAATCEALLVVRLDWLDEELEEDDVSDDDVEPLSAQLPLQSSGECDSSAEDESESATAGSAGESWTTPSTVRRRRTLRGGPRGSVLQPPSSWILTVLAASFFSQSAMRPAWPQSFKYCEYHAAVRKCSTGCAPSWLPACSKHT
eukprot:3380387-Lingulodinium_polyedra.AAC.1